MSGWPGVSIYDVPAAQRAAYFCWIMPEPVHVHLGFVYVVLMDAPDRALDLRYRSLTACQECSLRKQAV